MERSNLIIVEKGRVSTIDLDRQDSWSLGRSSGDSRPDIPLSAGYVSRKHGSLSRIDGIWYYTDYNSKNGTTLNGRRLAPGLGGRYKPVMLSDGDTFVFGGGDRGAINEKTAWALFSARCFAGEWRVLDTSRRESVIFTDGTGGACARALKPGTAGILKNGMGIYMGDKTYLSGNIWLSR